MAYCTVDKLKTYLSITSTKHDTLLSDCIDAAQRQIEQYTVKTFEASTETSTQTFDANNPYVSKYGDTFMVPYDLRSITELTIDDNDVLPYAKQYKSFDGIIYEIALKNTSPYSFKYCSTTMYDTISITGLWGYSETPPSDVKQACIVLATYIYQRKDTTIVGDRTILPNERTVKIEYGMPLDVKTILDKYRRIVLYEYS